MSLYHEAAEVLNKIKTGDGSLKTAVFSKKTWKSDSKTLFALTAEAAKWSNILSEVVENSSILKIEKNLTPELALLLTHDLLLAKQGIRLPAKHGLYLAVSRHKARLTAELTKSRIRRKHASLDALRASVNARTNLDSAETVQIRQPRWIRINTLRSTLDDELATTFADYERVLTLKELMSTVAEKHALHVDEHIPNLVAIVSTNDLSKLKAYKAGKLIFQEKASCFPAYLLSPRADDSHIIDACAAPGNKTTHLAALLNEIKLTNNTSTSAKAKITACEKDVERSKTLEKMVKLASAEKIVNVKSKQDFLRLDHFAKEFANVTALLLDPSCSGSGILNRDEATFTVHLPSVTTEEVSAQQSKKRKRSKVAEVKVTTEEQVDTVIEEETAAEDQNKGESDAQLTARLLQLSTFQLRLLQHAMLFPAAKRITYSTCSIHDQENEHVVMKALLSSVASGHGWKIMARAVQPDGMRKWHKRGSLAAVKTMSESLEGAYSELNHDEIADACIRCDKRGEEGTMGFFVAGFVRDEFVANEKMSQSVSITASNGANGNEITGDEGEVEEEWEGFGDDD